MRRFAGRYELLRLLGRGGMGTVHLALDHVTGHECALKQLSPDVGATTLDREFEILCGLHHPRVVRVFDFGRDQAGTAYYTMEYVPGAPLDQVVPPGDWRGLVKAGAQVAQGLEALHAGSILHGDLKPGNVLAQTHDGALSVRMVDFGLAQVLGGGGVKRGGSLGYMAPELGRGGPPTVAADLYGLGAILLRLATGISPSACERPADALAERGAPAALARLIIRLLAAEPAERLPSAREVRRELEAMLPGGSSSLRDRVALEVLVGREAELGRLERWMGLGPPAARAIFLVGESGIGRTALLNALAARAELAGRFVRWVALTQRSEGAAVRDLVRSLGPDLSGASLPPKHGIEHLVEVGSGLLSGQQPLLVLVDRAERLDPASRAAIRRWMLEPSLASIGWVIAFAGQLPDLPREERALLSLPEVEVLALGPLAREDSDRLLAAVLQEPVPVELCSRIWQGASGHPGHTLGLLRAAVETQALVESEGELLVARDALARLQLPDNAETARLARLAQLPGSAQRPAWALAILERPIAESELAVVAGASDGAGLEELLVAGLVRRDGDLWELASPGLAAAIREQVPRAELVSLHERILACCALSERERVRHLHGVGRISEALHLALEVFTEAPELDLALQAIAMAEQAAPEQAPAWHERMARLLLAHGRHAEAIPHLERTLSGGRPGPDHPESWHLLATALIRVGRPRECLAAVERALAECPPAPLRGLLLCSRAAALLSEGQSEEAAGAVEEALRIGRGGGQDGVLWVAALSRGGLALAQGEFEAAVELGREAAEAAGRAGDHAGRLRALGLQAAALMSADLAESDRLFQQATREARERDLRMALGELITNRAEVLLQAGRWKEAREAHAEAFRLALEDGRTRMAAVALAKMVLDDTLTGDLGRARRLTRRALTLAQEFCPAITPLVWRATARRFRLMGLQQSARRALARARGAATGQEARWCDLEAALLETHRRRWVAARRLSQAALSASPVPEPMLRVLLLACSGRAALRTNGVAEAVACLQHCDELLEGRAAMPYLAAHRDQLAAEIELAAGRHGAGTRLAKQATARLAALPAPAERALAELEVAALALARGAPPASPRQWLAGAAEVFARLGDEHSEARALRLQLQHLGAAGPDGAARPVGNLLRAVGRLIERITDPPELARRAIELAVEQLGAERGAIVVTESGALVPIAEHGYLDQADLEQALGYSRRVVEVVVERGGGVLAEDAPRDPDLVSISIVDQGLRSILCVPLLGQGGVLGAVYLDDSRRPGAFGAADRKLLEGLAELLAVAIEKGRGQEAIRSENERLLGENLALRRQAGTKLRRTDFIADSPAMRRVVATIERAAQVSSSVLITGEKGTGKELVARLLHHCGKRSSKPFVLVNWGAIPATLLESELFGILAHVATGVGRRPGRFQDADGGTLFLDEIGEMPLAQQVALLSVLANREVTPVGGGRPFKVDVRVIAATNRDLRRQIEEGSFREDLYYRLNVIEIELPPLRRRPGDIPALARRFARLCAAQQERKTPAFSPEFVAALLQSKWKGNVRELQNYVERVMAMTPGDLLEPRPLPHDLQRGALRLTAPTDRPLRHLLADLERQIIERTLDRTGGNQRQAARELGVTEQSLRYRLRRYETASTARRIRRVRRK